MIEANNILKQGKDYNMIEGKKLQISQTGKFEIGDTDLRSHEYLVIDPIAIEQEGYMYPRWRELAARDQYTYCKVSPFIL